MLIKFRFKNYKSFKNLQEFNMLSGNTKSYSERLFHEKNYSILKFSAIYGANGAGKSNVIEALSIMQLMIMKGLPPYSILHYFKLDDTSKNEPTYFEVYLQLQHKVYSYGFEVNLSKNIIESEWLTFIDGKKEEDVFTRNLIDHTYFVNKKYDDLSETKLSMYLDDTKQDNSKLFLSYINSNKTSIVLEKVPPIKQTYQWFETKLSITEPDSVLTSGSYFVVDEKIEMLAKLLKAFGTGINSIRPVEVNQESAMQNIPSKLIDEIKTDAKKKKATKMSALIRSNSFFWNIVINGDKTLFKKICFYHDNDNKYPFNLSDESEGTIRLIDLAETLLTDAEGRLFVIDELDRKLHPQLTCRFVKEFLKKCNKKNNQLIVSTHESRLLDFDILRRDEIWFVNKDEHGESKLYSLDEYNVRFDKKIDKAYLDGRYGGVPVFDTVFPTFDKCHE